ncbi:MAG: xylulokinase [Granulosicoccus sp.]
MYLGIDLGTSSAKTVLMDDEQRIVASHSAALVVSRPMESWSEQNPLDWITAIEQTLDALTTTNKKAMSAVRGIGLSGHMHGATLLDTNDKVLRPCMLWNDTRSHREAAALDTDLSRELTGNILFPGFTAPKVDWVRANEPAVFDRIAKIFLPKDYVRLWLTGEHTSDMSDAAGTGWLDVEKRDWSDELLNACQLNQQHMPTLVEGTAISGKLRTKLAIRWGMSASVVVAGGAGDNAASACGMGVVEPGSAFLSLGTSGVLFAANDAYRPNADSAVHTFCHALPDTWHQMGVILAATDALNWLAGITGKTPAELTAPLKSLPATPVDVIFLPYLGGERTPHNNAAARGAFIGLGHATDTTVLTQAVLQGVAFAFRDCQNALLAAGTSLSKAAAIGGGAKSDYWLRVIANVMQLPLNVTADGDFGASLGAARLGMIAAENADPLVVCKQPPVDHEVEPELTNQSDFDELYVRYADSYLVSRPAE